MIALGVHFFWRNNRFFTFIAALSLNVGHSCGFASCGKWGKRKESKADTEERNLVAVCHLPSGKSV